MTHLPPTILSLLLLLVLCLKYVPSLPTSEKVHFTSASSLLSRGFPSITIFLSQRQHPPPTHSHLSHLILFVLHSRLSHDVPTFAHSRLPNSSHVPLTKHSHLRPNDRQYPSTTHSHLFCLIPFILRSRLSQHVPTLAHSQLPNSSHVPHIQHSHLRPKGRHPIGSHLPHVFPPYPNPRGVPILPPAELLLELLPEFFPEFLEFIPTLRTSSSENFQIFSRKVLFILKFYQEFNQAHYVSLL